MTRNKSIKSEESLHLYQDQDKFFKTHPELNKHEVLRLSLDIWIKKEYKNTKISEHDDDEFKLTDMQRQFLINTIIPNIIKVESGEETYSVESMLNLFNNTYTLDLKLKDFKIMLDKLRGELNE